MNNVVRLHPLRLALCSAAVAPFASVSLPAGAQALEEVIVTAQRREQSMQDIPMSISAFSGEDLELRQIDGLVNLQYQVPNLLVDGLRTSIRGVGNNAISSTAEAGLGYHVNDVYLNEPLFVSSEYFDLERVEVLRGPQGTLYGRNTTAGVINIHTRKPHDELGGYLATTVGNYDTLKFKGALNLPVTDSIRQRFSGMYLNRDGYTDNDYTGDAVDGRDSYELRSSTSFDFSDSLSADLVVSYLKEDSDRSFRTKGVCTKDADYGCSPLSTGFETPDVSGSLYQTLNLINFGGSLLPLGDYFADASNPDDFRTVNIDQEPTYDVEQLGLSLELNYEWGDYAFTSLTGYYDTEGDVFWDFDRFATDVRLNRPVTYRANGKDVITSDLIQSGRRELRDVEQFTQEFRIASSYDGWFNFLLGAFYYDEDRASQTLITHPVLAASQQSLGLPDEYEMYNIQTDPAKTESFALFGEAYSQINDQTRLTLGLRYTDDEKSSRSRALLLNITDPTWGEAADDWQEFTGKATLEFSVNEDSLLFASFSRGYKAGGLNPPGTEDMQAFDPEYLYAYEIGSKNLFLDGRLQANFGAFYYDYEDMQIGQINETAALTVNSDAEVMGAEAEFTFAATESLLFDMSLSWLDMELNGFISSDEGDPDGIAPGTVAARDENGDILLTDDGFVIKDLDGNTLRNAPEYSLNVGAEYTFSLDAGYDITARADYFWQDDYYANEFNKPSDKLDGWEQVDAQITLRPSAGNWHVMAYVKNALDNDDPMRMNQDGRLVGRFRSVTVIEPRTYGLEVRLSWE
ncbi:MAG: TonB-dependent receptor [Halioglobus sp.]